MYNRCYYNSDINENVGDLSVFSEEIKNYINYFQDWIFVDFTEAIRSESSHNINDRFGSLSIDRYTIHKRWKEFGRCSVFIFCDSLGKKWSAIIDKNFKILYSVIF